MPNASNRGKSPHAAKHFCSIDQAAAMGEEAVKIARAERIAAAAELVKGFEGRIAGLESRLTRVERETRPLRQKVADWVLHWWSVLTAHLVPEAKPHNGPILTEEAPTNG